MKSLEKSCLYQLPSGAAVHPNRLIVRDGTLMWKHALLFEGEPQPLTDEAHEQHIIKTAQRLEELNSWVSSGCEPWECLLPIVWYVPHIDFLNQGISLFFNHVTYDYEHVYQLLQPHIQSHETLELTTNKQLYFQRC